MNTALRLNPEQKAAGLNLIAVGLSGPALVYLGLRHGPTIAQKVAFTALGVLVIGANYAALRETFSGPVAE